MEAFVSTQNPMSGQTDFDKILASIQSGISGYLNPAAQAPAPAPAAAPVSAQTDWLFLLVIAVGVYALVH